MKKYVWFLVVILIASLMLSACAPSTKVPATEEPAADKPTADKPVTEEPPVSQKEKVLVIGDSNDILTLDPAMMKQNPDWPIATAIYSGLVSYKPGYTAEVQPDLAEKWDVSEDGLVWTFYLRKGVQWHRGFGEVTAKDVVWTYERIKDEALGSAYRPDLSLINTIEAVDDYTVKFTFIKPSAIFLPTVAAYRPGRIVCQKAFEEYGKDYNANAVGSGPYILDHWTSGSEIVLVKNPDYWNADNFKIDRIEYKVIPERSVAILALQSGDIDLVFPDDPSGLQTLKGAEGINLDVPDGTNIVKIYLNLNREMFQDIRVRQALNYSIDKNAITQILKGLGAPAVSEIPPFHLGFTEDVEQYEYNPEKAKQLLAEAGYPDGIDFNLIVWDWGTYTLVGEALPDMMRQSGINVKLEILEGGLYNERRTAREFDGGMQGLGRSDPHQVLYGFHSSSIAAGTNITQFSSPELDALLDAQATTIDTTERSKIIAEIQKLLRKEAVTIPVYINMEACASRDYVTGAKTGIQRILPWELMDVNK